MRKKWRVARLRQGFGGQASGEWREKARREEWLRHGIRAGMLEVVCVMGLVMAWACGAQGQAPEEEEKVQVKVNAKAVGIFEGHGDVGEVGAEYAGKVEYDAGKGTYTITGGGENIWFGKDAFHFAWKQVSGDVTLTADVAFLGEGKNPHRKAVLMVRQSLDGDAAYADIAVHGVGMTSIQFRDEKGGLTHEVQASLNAPRRVRIVKRGNYFTMWVAGEDGKFALAGASPAVALKEPFYVGIGVCSHEKDLVERAVFSGVELKIEEGHKGDQRSATSEQKAREKIPGSKSEPGAPKEKLYSVMEIMNVESKDRKAIYVAEGRFEAPNWMPDGKSLIFNRKGRIEKIEVTGGKTETIDTGFAVQCNNDHGISPDGKWLAVSDNSQEASDRRPATSDQKNRGGANAGHPSLIYILPIGGGTPRRITKNAPSYWHGWSPDGKTLAFVGMRNGDFDIYTIAVEEGESTKKPQDLPFAKSAQDGAPRKKYAEEKRLTTAKGLDDGPEYTPDGKYIYFNSERTGHMQIWRMKADGSEQEQVTFGPENDWFPHFSPDGEKMVFLTYDASVKGHPENKDVMLRMMTMKDGKIVELGKLFGGQGTINVPSWSPDGKEIAFVSYAMVE